MPALPAKKQRRDLTVVRNVVKASPATTWQLAQSKEGRIAILKQFDHATRYGRTGISCQLVAVAVIILARFARPYL